MVLLKRNEYGLATYELPDEKLHLGTAKLSSVAYYFFSDGDTEKLMQVELYFQELENYQLLKTICQGRFGQEFKKIETFPYVGIHYWVRRGLIVELSYHADEKLKLGNKLLLVYTPISTEYREARKKKQVEEAEKDW